MTVVEICNHALALLGHDRTITSLSDGSAEAARCSLFYPVSRDAVLASFAWEFASKDVSVTTAQYTLPADCLRVVSVRDASGAVPVSRAGNKVTASRSGTLRYVSNTVDVGSFPHLVADAVVAELAFRLFGPVLGNPKSKEESDVQQSYAALARERLDAARASEIEEHAYAGSPSSSSVTDLDLCNRALAVLGNDRTVWSLEKDPSAEAVRCRQLLPMARRRVLSSHAWEFAQKTATVGESRDVPSDFVLLVSASDASGKPVSCRVQDGKVSSGVSSITYVSSSVTAALMPAAVQDAVVMALAAGLSASVGAGQEGGGERLADVRGQADAAIANAVRAEAGESVYRVSPSDPSALARTDVCNRALSVLGSAVVLKDFDTDWSQEANLCRQFLPMAVLHVLASHPWEFATVSEAASDGSSVPSGFVRLVDAKDASGATAVCRVVSGRFAGSGVASVRYVSSSVPMAAFPAWVQEAVMLALAVSMFPAVAGASDGAADRLGALTARAEAALAAAVSQEMDESVYRATPSDPSAVAKTDVCNRALSALGSPVVLKDFDGDTTREANRCRQFLPVAMRATLQGHDWDFAAVERPLVLVEDPSGWCRVSQPDGCARVVRVHGTDGVRLHVRRAGGVLMVDAQGRRDALIRYVQDSVDLADSPSEFVDCVVARLAALLSGSLVQRAEDRAALMADAERRLSRAVADESNETAFPGEWENPFLKARR